MERLLRIQCSLMHAISIGQEEGDLLQSSKVIIAGGSPIGQDNLLATLPTWGPTFRLTLDLYIHSFDGRSLNYGFAELLRLTSTESECCAIGDRIPAIFTHRSGNLHIATQIGYNGNTFTDLKLVKRKWHQLELVQYVQSGKV